MSELAKGEGVLVGSVFDAARMIDNAVQRNWFVYLCLCQDEGPIYVKAGMSNCPDRRLTAIKMGCPIPVHQFYICKVPSKQKALILEKALHIAFGRWAVTGEWFRLKMEDKPAFNSAWKSVFEAQASIGRLKWERARARAIKRRAAGARTWAVKRTFRKIEECVKNQFDAVQLEIMDKNIAEGLASGPSS